MEPAVSAYSFTHVTAQVGMIASHYAGALAVVAHDAPFAFPRRLTKFWVIAICDVLHRSFCGYCKFANAHGLMDG